VKLRRILVAGAALAAIMLTACEPVQFGAAAIVDGQRIALDDVQAAVRDVRDLQAQVGQPAPQPEQLARVELQRRLILAVYERAARELGVRVTPGEVSAELAEARQAAGSEEEFARQLAAQNLSPATAPEYVRQALLARKIGQRLAPARSRQGQGQPGQAAADQAAQDQALTERLIQTAKRMRFEVNPRYGTFDTSNGQLTPRQDDFLRPANAEPTEPATVP
jgi:hypothetical protein